MKRLNTEDHNYSKNNSTSGNNKGKLVICISGTDVKIARRKLPERYSSSYFPTELWKTLLEYSIIEADHLIPLNLFAINTVCKAFNGIINQIIEQILRCATAETLKELFSKILLFNGAWTIPALYYSFRLTF